MPPNHEDTPSAASSPYVLSPRLRIQNIGEVTRLGACWRLTYERCDHVQEFAREGLEDSARVGAYIRRNFPECLTCRFMDRGARTSSC